MRKQDQSGEDARTKRTTADDSYRVASPLFQKRQVTMPDGRYLIYFTFPAIDKEFDGLRPTDAHKEQSR